MEMKGFYYHPEAIDAIYRLEVDTATVLRPADPGAKREFDDWKVRHGDSDSRIGYENFRPWWVQRELPLLKE
jgi:hypothetical protein